MSGENNNLQIQEGKSKITENCTRGKFEFSPKAKEWRIFLEGEGKSYICHAAKSHAKKL